jgi:beta-carotene 3-hydroxylase
MTAVLLAVGALVVMEPITTFAHRVVFHGFGMGWHRSHHEPPRHALEANDGFPIVFAAATIVVLAVGAYVGGGEVLTPLGIGVTAYGACYLLVHDVVIHRRIGWLQPPPHFLQHWRIAHNVHHLYSRAPYGFLVPIVPADLKAKAAALGTDRTDRSPSGRSPAGRAAGRRTVN